MLVNPNSLVTLQEVRSYLKIPDNQITADTFLQDWIDAISLAIEEFVRGPVRLQDFEDVLYDGNNSEILYVHHAPLFGLLNGTTADLQYRASPSSAWADLVSDVANILIDPARPYCIYLSNAVFPNGRLNIKLSTKAGYGKSTRIINEKIGTGNGVLTAFSGSLHKLAVVKSSVSVVTTIDGPIAVSGTDDGNGAITGTGISAGTIDYETGDISLTFDDFVTNAVAVNVSYRYYAIPGQFTTVAIESVAEKFKESGRGDGRLGQSGQIMPNNAGSNTYFSLSERHKQLLLPFIRQVP